MVSLATCAPDSVTVRSRDRSSDKRTVQSPNCCARTIGSFVTSTAGSFSTVTGNDPVSKFGCPG